MRKINLPIFFEKVAKNKRLLVFLAIFFVAIFLRAYGFSDLLVFKSDQARDALIMEQVSREGFSSIPLLGPQVGGTELRLGPMTYYFQYFSAIFFGFSPESLAYPDLLFGILAVPLIFLLSRRFFSFSLSIWIMALASSSLFLVTFSRFAWNPNSLPFFTVLFALTFLTALESEGKKRFSNLVLAAMSFAVVAQLHLAAIVGLALGMIFFQIAYKPLKFKEIILFLFIFLLFQLPVFISEFNTKGANAREFVEAVSRKNDSDHHLHEKAFRSYQEGARVTWLVLLGQQNTDLISTRGFAIKCDEDCKSALPYSLISMIIFGCMIFSICLVWKKETDFSRKRVVAFMGLWTAGFLLFSVPLAYQLETRFYLGLAAPLFISLGFMVNEFLNAKARGKKLQHVIVAIGLLAILLNIRSTVVYLQELNISKTSEAESAKDLRFGTSPKVTLRQLRTIAEESDERFPNDAPVIVTGESLYVKSVFFLTSVEKNRGGCYMRGNKDVPAEFNNLIVSYTDEDKIAQKKFGTLSATFIPAKLTEKNIRLPEGCLDY